MNILQKSKFTRSLRNNTTHTRTSFQLGYAKSQTTDFKAVQTGRLTYVACELRGLRYGLAKTYHYYVIRKTNNIKI